MFYICFQGRLHTHQNREGESYEATSEEQKMKHFVIWSLREGSPETCQQLTALKCVFISKDDSSHMFAVQGVLLSNNLMTAVWKQRLLQL